MLNNKTTCPTCGFTEGHSLECTNYEAPATFASEDKRVRDILENARGRFDNLEEPQESGMPEVIKPRVNIGLSVSGPQAESWKKTRCICSLEEGKPVAYMNGICRKCGGFDSKDPAFAIKESVFYRRGAGYTEMEVRFQDELMEDLPNIDLQTAKIISTRVTSLLSQTKREEQERILKIVEGLKVAVRHGSSLEDIDVGRNSALSDLSSRIQEEPKHND